jgi:hypothetical protein
MTGSINNNHNSQLTLHTDSHTSDSGALLWEGKKILHTKFKILIPLRWRMFENRVLRKIFGLKRDEVIRGWRKLHNEEIHYLYCSPSTIRIIKSMRIRWAGRVARMGEKRSPYGILVGKLEGKIPLGRPRCRWKDNIRMDAREIGWGGMDLIDLAQDRDQWRALVNMVMNLQVA